MECKENVKVGRGDIDFICIEDSKLKIIEVKKINPKNGYNFDTGTDPYIARRKLKLQIENRVKKYLSGEILNLLDNRPIITEAEIYGVLFERKEHGMTIHIYRVYIPSLRDDSIEKFYITITYYYTNVSNYNFWEGILRNQGIDGLIEILERHSIKGSSKQLELTI